VVIINWSAKVPHLVQNANEFGSATGTLVGLSPGPHKVRLELSDAIHRPIPGAYQTVEFTVPDTKGPQHQEQRSRERSGISKGKLQESSWLIILRFRVR
jgi:hypothetical protein